MEIIIMGEFPSSFAQEQPSSGGSSPSVCLPGSLEETEGEHFPFPLTTTTRVKEPGMREPETQSILRRVLSSCEKKRKGG